jgi:hypothetical protein
MEPTTKPQPGHPLQVKPSMLAHASHRRGVLCHVVVRLCSSFFSGAKLAAGLVPRLVRRRRLECQNLLLQRSDLVVLGLLSRTVPSPLLLKLFVGFLMGNHNT